MTRRLPLLLAGLAASLFSLVALAVPALATEGEEAASAGFGSGQWDGVLLAVVVGAILGALMFADADPGGIPRADAHH